jgi:phage/plasmid-like protein (TIGR03299 family)
MTMKALAIDPRITTMAQKFDTVQGTPWEALGASIPPKATVDQVLALAGLDWLVTKRQAWIDVVSSKDIAAISSEEVLAERDEDKGPMVPRRVMGNYVLLRDDTMEPISPFVGPRYKPIQNHDAFRVFQDFCDAGNMTMETAGSIYDGQHIWGLARINGDYELCDGEIITGYFLLMQSHVYGSALKAMFTPVRYPGGHTMVQPFGRKGKMKRAYTMPHSRVFNEKRIAEIKEVMGLAQAALVEFVGDARQMAETMVSDRDAIVFMIKTFHPELMPRILSGDIKLPEKLEDLATWEHSNRNLKKAPAWSKEYAGANLASCDGTAWGLVQTANYAFDHVIGQSADNRMASSWMGVNAKKKLKALQGAMAF